MNEIDKTNLTDQTKFRLNENYFNQEIYQRKSCIKKLSKYVDAFDSLDKILIFLSATSGGVCIISSLSVAGAPTGIAGACFTLFFYYNNSNNEDINEHKKKQKEKKNMIKFICWLIVN